MTFPKKKTSVATGTFSFQYRSPTGGGKKKFFEVLETQFQPPLSSFRSLFVHFFMREAIGGREIGGFPMCG